MSPKEVDANVRKVFSIVLGRVIPPGEEVLRVQDSAWDSLKHMDLMFSLEEQFGFQFTQDDLPRLNSLGQIVNFVEAYLATHPSS